MSAEPLAGSAPDSEDPIGARYPNTARIWNYQLGGKAEVLGNSFVGPTDCKAYGGPYCIYPWFSTDSGGAINYGVGSTNLGGGVDQFAQTATCPETGVFPGATYCDTIVK